MDSCRYCEELRVLGVERVDLKEWRGEGDLGKIKVRFVTFVKSFCRFQD